MLSPQTPVPVALPGCTAAAGPPASVTVSGSGEASSEASRHRTCSSSGLVECWLGVKPASWATWLAPDCCIQMNVAECSRVPFTKKPSEVFVTSRKVKTICLQKSHMYHHVLDHLDVLRGLQLA